MTALRVEVNGRNALLSVGIGVAATPRRGGNVEQLVSAADAALYQAKRSGWNCVAVAGQPARMAA